MTGSLNGTYRHSIDSKGRVAIPAKFRSCLGNTFYITLGAGGCLFVFSSEEWAKFNAAARDSLKYDKFLKTSRVFNAMASEVEPDSQGRVLLSQQLRKIAKLTDQAVIIGCSSRAEIWNPEAWDKESSSLEDSDILELLEAIQF